jgi:hypothetical protein
MHRILSLLALVVCPIAAQNQPHLAGFVTDASGAAMTGISVQLRGGGAARRTKTDAAGEYAFAGLAAGKYELIISAKGFASAKQSVDVNGATRFDVRLEIEAPRSSVKVSGAGNRVAIEPDANAGAVVMGQRQIAALSDDPDELALQLQALAGPAPGPNGGQFFVDGFTAGNLPSKSNIREVRVNANPFSSEYDRPGFGRVEIFTKPGSAAFHGDLYTQYNAGFLDSRNPLLAESGAPPYASQFYGVNVSGPLRRNRASFTFDSLIRKTRDDAFILAQTPAGRINQTVPAPQTGVTLNPRIDYALSPKSTLTARYQDIRASLHNLGVGDFSLPSRAYNQRQTEEAAQITETTAVSTHAVNETRFQFLRATSLNAAGAATPGINVIGSFFGGGATAGNSGPVTNSWELTNLSTYMHGKHNWKWGGRVRYAGLTDTSLSNFAGTFTFYTLDQYIAGTPSQFSINAGNPTMHVPQTDFGFFLNDDWRMRSNLTLSLGLRYEAQTNIGDRKDWAPRLGLAWGSSKTVLRLGAGVFYDRIPNTLTLNALRFDGVTQQSFLILNPPFFPNVPPIAALEASAEPQQLRPMFRGIQAPGLYQASASLEHQWNSAARSSFGWIGSRGVHLLNSRNVNAPVDGAYPFVDPSIRLLAESAGLSRQNQFMAQTNVNAGRVSLFETYTLSYGEDNNEGIPANPYDLRAEWGPSSYGAIRHRLLAGGSIPMPAGFSLSLFFVVNSGAPYNITTGFDPNNTGFPEARPALLPVSASACQGPNLKYAAAFGCFDLMPAPRAPVIGRNFAVGPGAVNAGLRVARTWSFGGEAHGAAPQAGHSGPDAMFQAPASKRYNVTLSAFTLNAINHPNYGAPEGNLSSPYFGQARSLGGLVVMTHGGAASTYNRKIDLQLRFTF